MRLHFTAAEASGDLLAREVIDALRAQAPGLEIVGIGGSEMADVGVESPFDISPLSILGLVEGLKVYGTVLKLADAAADHIIASRPDAAVLVDSWGFMIRVAERVRRRAPEIRLIKLVGPQVWAMRAGRAKSLARAVDHVLCLHEMEPPFYAGTGLKTTVIGNPALSRTRQGDGPGFRARHGLSAAAPVLLVLPGSRASEIANVAPVLMRAARLLKADRPDLQVIAAPASAVAAQFEAAFPDATSWCALSTVAAERYDAMAAANLALACSGTVTNELAVQGTPMIVGYKVGWMTWAIARGLLYRPRHITLLNIAADDTEIVPEFVQTRFNASQIAAAARRLLDDPAALYAQSRAQHAALAAMGQGTRATADRAAEAILEDVAAARPGSEA